jgi:hypothetical protein
MSDEQMTKYLQQLYEVDPTGKLAAEFTASGKLPDASVLEGYSNYTDKYVNFDDFRGDKYKTLANFYQSQDGKMPSEARMMSFQKQHPDISAQEVTDWFNKTNKYREDIVAQRKSEAGKKRREMEIKNDWNLVQHALASDYEKQRYIDDPQSAIFGKEASGLVGSSAGAKADLATGVLAGAADLVPKPGFVAVGPAIRGLRDVGHKVTDSPYQKDWSTIGSDFGKDVVFGGATFALANARRGARIASAYASPEVRGAYEVATEGKAINQSLNGLVNNMDQMDNIQLANYIKNLPESSMKSELMGLSEGFMGKGIDRDAIRDVIVKYDRAVNPEVQAAAKNVVAKGYKLPDEAPFLQKAISTEPVKKTSDKITLGLLKGADALNTGKPGYMIFSGSRTAAGRGTKPERKQTALERKIYNQQIDWYKKNYTHDWEAGFAPKQIDGDPLWEAYKEWKEGR